MSYRGDILWTRLPDGFTREELDGARVEFQTPTHEGTGTLRAFQKPDGYFEIQIEVETSDHSDFQKVQTIHHQTSNGLFQIERLSNPGQAAFRLSFYMPSQSDLQDARAAALPHSYQTTQL